MTDSLISSGRGGITFAGPAAVDLFRAASLRSALKLNLAGLKNSRYSLTTLLAMAGQYTGNSYKRSQVQKAIDELTAWCDAANAAIPHERR